MRAHGVKRDGSSIVRRWGAVLVAVALLGGGGATLAPSALADGVPLRTGDVLVPTASPGSGSPVTVAHFNRLGTLVDTLDTTQSSGGVGLVSLCRDSAGTVYVPDFGTAVTTFSADGHLLDPTWFGPSPLIASPASCTVDAADHVYVGGADPGQVLEFDRAGHQLATFNVAGGIEFARYVALASDQCTLFYTDGVISRYDVCTDTQLPDFAAPGGSDGACADLALRPNGEVMAACFSDVVRLDATGRVIQRYPLGSGTVAGLSLDPDGTSFWASDASGGGLVYHVDIATGSILGTIDPGVPADGVEVVGAISVSQPGVVVTPTGVARPIHHPHRVTATITNPGGSAAGQTVTFLVTGANHVVGTARTNARGQAEFTYVGLRPGPDTITAKFTNPYGVTTSGAATVKWFRPLEH